MATRALQLEVAADNSTTQFVFAFRRFIARRGSPDMVISDNAPNFKLGKQILTNQLTRMAEEPQMQNLAIDNDTHEFLMSSYQELRSSLEQFWNIWYRDYLQALAEKTQAYASPKRGSRDWPKEEQRWLQPLASSKFCGSDTPRMRQQRMGERCQQRNGTTLHTSHTSSLPISSVYY
ncbi:hypothetical protein ANCDUO_06601 [Ancylostoma duodenale]|uniref:Integrase catalytic domain-containing protein n=1 Tax=Ancylostoma duodenale TaxID=51022 RepID=A0A0C2GVL1_9BILA|nr:hypothetical protein ANCDUO_06601 [Ancylostoma duodenale]